MKSIKKILNRLRGEPDLNKLKKRGLKIGKNFKMMGGCIIDPSHCWHITIGDNVTLAPRVHVIAHDASTKQFLNYTKVANVSIGNNVFIGAGTIILPGVSIGNNVIIGAGSVVSSNIDDNILALGIPARKISTIQDYLLKEKNNITDENSFNENYTLRNKMIGHSEKQELLNTLSRFNNIYVK